jgi:hypothetical protein
MKYESFKLQQKRRRRRRRRKKKRVAMMMMTIKHVNTIMWGRKTTILL